MTRATSVMNDLQQIANEVASDLRLTASQRDASRALSADEVDRYAHSGLWAITVPEAYGGPGLGHQAVARVTRIIAAADPSIAQIPRSHFHLIEVLKVVGSEAQKRFFFDQALANKKLMQAASEIGTKTISEIKTTLTQRDGKLYLNGKKFYATGCIHADWIAIVAKDELGFMVNAVVARDAAGVTVENDWAGFGQRVTASGTVKLVDAQVDESMVFGYTEAFVENNVIGAGSQLIHAAIDLGIACEALADTKQYVRQHTRPWMDSGLERATDDPLLIDQIARLEVATAAASAMLDQASASMDQMPDRPDEQAVAEVAIAVGMAKVLADEAALLATNKLFELCGASSTREQLNLNRHWRNARTHTLHDPVRWKLQAIGDYFLNGKLPKRHNYI